MHLYISQSFTPFREWTKCNFFFSVFNFQCIKYAKYFSIHSWWCICIWQLKNILCSKHVPIDPQTPYIHIEHLYLLIQLIIPQLVLNKAQSFAPLTEINTFPRGGEERGLGVSCGPLSPNPSYTKQGWLPHEGRAELFQVTIDQIGWHLY